MTKSEAQRKLEELMASLNNGYGKAKSAMAAEGRDARFLTLPNGKTVVRFLPPQKGMIHPWVKKYVHFFESASTGEIVAVDCPFSVKAPCKICQNNSNLYNACDEASKKLANKYKRKVSYYANVFVKESKEEGEVGEVKVYRFGKKIYEKLVDGMELHGMFYAPDSTGADFIIVKKEVKSGNESWPNYDSSTFLPGQALANDAMEIMRALEAGHDLKVFEYQHNEDDPQLAKVFQQHVLGRPTAAPTAAPIRPAPKAAPQPVAAEEDEMPAWDTTNLVTPTADTVTAGEDDDASFLADLEKELNG